MRAFAKLASSAGSNAVLLTVLGLLGLGSILWLSGRPDLAGVAWALGVVGALIPLGATVLRDVLRGKTGVDLIALLAMAGSLALRQYLIRGAA